MKQWLRAQGIGLNWIQEGEGANSIPHFEQALKICRDKPALGGARLDESLFNVACGYSVAGHPGVACEHLARVLDAQPRAQRKKTLSRIRKDPDLQAVRDSACFKSLKARAKK